MELRTISTILDLVSIHVSIQWLIKKQKQEALWWLHSISKVNSLMRSMRVQGMTQT